VKKITTQEKNKHKGKIIIVIKGKVITIVKKSNINKERIIIMEEE